MREHDAERCIVADGAEIAEMVGDTLQLCHYATQPLGTWRNLDAECRLDGPSESE